MHRYRRDHGIESNQALRPGYTRIEVKFEVILKGKLLGFKWVGNKKYQTVDHPKRELQVGSGLFGIRLLILHFPNPSTIQHFIFPSI